MRPCFTVLLLLLVTTTPALARDDAAPATRGDLARALRRFEAAWEDAREALPDARRQQVVRQVNAATLSFFTSRYDDAVAALGRASALLREGDAAVEALGLRVTPPLVEARGDAAVTVEVFRPRGVAASAAQRVTLALGEARAELVLPAVAGAVARVELRPRLAPGVHALAMALDGGPHLTRPVAAVEDLAARLGALDDRLPSVAAEHRRGPTLRARRERLGRLLAGVDDGVDRDLAAELSGLERDLVAVLAGEDPFVGRAGDELRAVLVGGAPVVYRIAAPPGPASGPRPLLVALRGAGGDEDMFFASYGAGIVPRLAAAAGAIVVTPRAPGAFDGGARSVAAIVDEVARDHAVDPARVYLLGHSMGAMAALEAARLAPARYRAVVAFAGARPGTTSSVPTFLACGTGDVALAGVRGFVSSAEREGRPVTFDLRPGLEHLLIVREAAPAAFEFLAAHGLERAPVAPSKRWF